LAAAFSDRTGLGWHQPTPPGAAGRNHRVDGDPAHNNAHSLLPMLNTLAAQDTAGTV